MIKTVGAYALPKAISYGLNFLMIPVLTRILSPADFGVVALAWAVHNTLAGVCTLGIPGAVSRYFFEYRQDHDKLSALIVSAKIMMYALFPCWLLVMWIWCKPIASLVGVGPQYADAFFWTFVAAYMNQITGFYLNLFQNLERASSYSLWLSVQTIVSVVLTLAFVTVGHMTYMGMIYGSLLGALTACVGASWQMRKFDSGRWHGNIAWENVVYGLSITPKSLSSFVNRFFDKYMLNNILSLSVVGIYNVGQSFINALSAGITSVQSAFQPRWFKEVFDDPQEGSQKAGSMFEVFSYISMMVMMLAVVLAKPFITLLLPSSYHGLVVIAPVLMLGLAAQLFGMFVGVQYAFAKKAYLIFPLTVVGTMLNVGANLALIPHWGIAGAAWSGVIGGYGANLLMVFVGQKVYRVAYPWPSLIMMHVLLWAAVASVLIFDWLISAVVAAAFVLAGFKWGIWDNFKGKSS